MAWFVQFLFSFNIIPNTVAIVKPVITHKIALAFVKGSIRRKYHRAIFQFVYARLYRLKIHQIGICGHSENRDQALPCSLNRIAPNFTDDGIIHTGKLHGTATVRHTNIHRPHFGF